MSIPAALNARSILDERFGDSNSALAGHGDIKQDHRRVG